MTFRETPPPAFPRHRGWATGEIGNLLGGRGSSLQASGVPWIQASHGISLYFNGYNGYNRKMGIFK